MFLVFPLFLCFLRVVSSSEEMGLGTKPRRESEKQGATQPRTMNFFGKFTGNKGDSRQAKGWSDNTEIPHDFVIELALSLFTKNHSCSDLVDRVFII